MTMITLADAKKQLTGDTVYSSWPTEMPTHPEPKTHRKGAIYIYLFTHLHFTKEQCSKYFHPPFASQFYALETILQCEAI